MQFDVFLILCDLYLAKKNCSKPEVPVHPSLSLYPISHDYFLKEVFLLAINLENNSLPFASPPTQSCWGVAIHTNIEARIHVCVTRMLSSSQLL